MQYSTAWRVTGVVLCFCCGLSAQTKSPTTPLPPSTTVAPTKKKPPKPKLTLQQEQGLRLLKSAEATAAGLQPPTQTYILWQVSHGYRKVDPARADTILRRAFSASRSIEEGPDSDECRLEQVCHVQRWLQRGILEEMFGDGSQKSNPERIEKLLPQANAEVKKQMLERLVSEYIRKQNFDRARELMAQIDDDHYSYRLAGELMASLPASRRDERLAAFSQSFRNYQNRSLEDLVPDDSDDFGILVIRFWRELPSLALDAIDTILERSKDRDESRKAHTVTLTLYNGKSLAFGSEYEFRLFQMLPILEELDHSKFEQLLGEHDKSRLGLDRYPEGMQSLDPNYYGDKPTDQSVIPAVMNVMPAMDDDPAKNSDDQSRLQLDAQIFAQIQTVTSEIAKNPETAFQDAMNLPLRAAFGPGCPRATALKRVALGVGKKNPTLAKAAMNEARRLAQDVDPARQALLLAEVPDFYLELGDEDGARGAIKDQMKLAEKLYAIDSDADDPNLVFKGAWPSANAWRNCIEHATKVSQAFAEELLAQISDPEIAGLEQVMYANALLGAEKSHITALEWHKNGRRGGIIG